MRSYRLFAIGAALLKEQQRMAKVIETNIRKQTAKRQAADPPEGPHTSYELGDLILAKYPNNVRPHKLQPPFLGPFQVIGRKGNRCYVVKHLSTEVEEDMDVERLTPYVPDPSCTNEEAARQDDLDECMGIDTILQHRCNGNKKRRNNYEFQIRWTDQSISWATYLSVKDARPVKLYVMDQHLFE